MSIVTPMASHSRGNRVRCAAVAFLGAVTAGALAVSNPAVACGVAMVAAPVAVTMASRIRLACGQSALVAALWATGSGYLAGWAVSTAIVSRWVETNAWANVGINAWVALAAMLGFALAVMLLGAAVGAAVGTLWASGSDSRVNTDAADPARTCAGK